MAADEATGGVRGQLRRIRIELGEVGFFLLIAAISTCGMCSNLDDIGDELEDTNKVLRQTNVELRETRQTIERLIEHQRAR